MPIRMQQNIAQNILLKRFHSRLSGVGNKYVKVAGCMDLQVSLTTRKEKENETFRIIPRDIHPNILLLRGTLCEKLKIRIKSRV